MNAYFLHATVEEIDDIRKTMNGQTISLLLCANDQVLISRSSGG